MSTDRDTTRIVRSWLMTDEHESANRVLDAVLDALDTTPQRRSTWWPARRLSDMNAVLKFGTAAVVVAAAALIGFTYFASPNVGSGGLDQPSPTAQPTATPLPRLQPTDELEAGTYRANAAIPIEVLVRVPDGWSAGGDWVIVGPDGVEPPDGMAIRFTSVRDLYANPATEAGGFLEPRVGPTVEDLADAMVTHPEWSATAVGSVTVDGYDGQHVRLTVPSDLEPASGRFLFFADNEGGGHWAFEPGQIFDFYIVDVEGERLVLELISYPDTPEADLAARQAIVDGLQIEP